MNKPIQIKIEETKKNIIDFINEECDKNGIDYYFLEIILKEIYQETLKLKNEEINQIITEITNKEADNSGISKDNVDNSSTNNSR